jgi:RNA polymerase sigma factor (sigma-70 family)
MKWCLACGAVQWGWSSCEGCGDEYRIDPLAFRDLYKAYARQLRRFVRRVAADRGLPESVVDTEGVVHDTFVVLLSASGQPIRNPTAWLFTVARNQLSKATAAQRRIAPGDPAEHWDEAGSLWLSMMSPGADPEDIRAAREVMQAIAGLPDHQRIATYLRQVEGWSLAEIGAYLNCAASTAGVHISRGTAKVRIALVPTSDRSGGGMRHVRVYRVQRKVRRFAALVAAAVLAAAATRAFGMPWSLAAFGAAIVVAPAIFVAALRWFWKALGWFWKALGWWRQGRFGWWLRAEADARRRQHRFNRWLRTGRALDPPGGTRRP